MAYIGQQLENPVTGEKLTFVETAASTNGERVVVDLELVAGGKVPGVHVHPNQEEKFEVLKGTMKFRYGAKKIVAEAGETVVVPPGKVHDFRNAVLLTLRCTARSRSGTSASRSRRPAILRMTTRCSAIARVAPRQRRIPPPNGIHS